MLAAMKKLADILHNKNAIMLRKMVVMQSVCG
jgi:hypothetical protein